MHRRLLATLVAISVVTLLALPAPGLAASKSTPWIPPSGATPTPTRPAGKSSARTKSTKPSAGAKSGKSAKGKPGRPAQVKKPVFIAPPGWPKLLSVPRIGIVKVPVESLALVKPDDYHAPYRWGDVAWYDRGPKPGDPGRATIFGHLDSFCCPAVFYYLKYLHPRDTVQVTYRDGRTLNFRVMWVATYPNDHLPMNFIFGATKVRGLVMFTCTGVFHRDGTGYDHKTVVYARLVLPNGQLG